MAQHSYSIANQSGASFRSDLNNALSAIVSQNSGAAAPTTTYAYQLWADTTTGLLKQRDAANASWITLGTLGSANLGLATLASPTFTGTPAAPTASAGTNTTQLATTAYVVSQATAKAGDTMTGDLTVPSLNGGPLAGAKNRLINGGMRIDQRNSGASISSGVGAVTYTVDRWYVYATGAAVSAQRVASSNTTFTYALRVIGAASNTGVSIGQRIEAQNSYDLAGRTVTLSFYAASSASVTLTWKAYYASATDNFATKTQSNTGTQATTATMTKYSTTFTLPAAATTGIAIEFSVASLTSGSIDITGVQLETGSVATPFERRNYVEEVLLAQRYFQYFGAGTTGQEETATTVSIAGQFLVVMRAAATATFNGSTYSTRLSGLDRTLTSVTINSSSISDQAAWILLNTPAGGNVAGRFFQNRDASSNIQMSAEL